MTKLSHEVTAMRHLIVALGVLVLAACSDVTGLGGATTGTYTLVSVNGRAIPYTVEATTNYRLDITGGSIQLRNDGTFTDVTTFYEVDGSTVSRPSLTTEGDYRVSGGTVTFEPYDIGASTYTAEISGRRLIQSGYDPNLGDYTFVYER